MPTEELGVKLSVEGMAAFLAACAKMDAAIDKTEKVFDGLGAGATAAGKATDQSGQAFDAHAARLNKLRLAMTQLDDVQVKLKNETNALARAQLEVKADALAKQIETLRNASENGKKGILGLGLSLTDLKSGIDMAVGAFKTVAAAAKEAFEFLQEGAAINATEESFNRLGISIEKMRAASNNTIPDVKLMSSTLTLMAGSSGEVADAFGAAMPQLLQMAKAANKLNPTMGDTTYMLESITTAAKRQSMQIADNLGIIVKQGDAYKEYADSIGVSVNALTNEQKQVAFLNGLLEAGNVLIEQAGGATESAADGYAVLTTTIKNMTDAMKASAAEGVSPLAQRFAEFMQAAQSTDLNLLNLGGSFQFLQTMLTGTSATTEEYNALLEVQATDAARAALTGAAWAAALDTSNDSTLVLTDSTINSQVAFDDYTAAMGTANSALQGVTLAQTDANNAAAQAQIDFNNAAAALSEMSIASFVQTQLQGLKVALDEGKISTAEYTAAQEALLTKFGLLTEKEKAAQGALDSLRQAAVDGTISWEAYALAAQKVKESLDAIPTEIGITIRWNEVGHMPNVPSGGTGNTAYARGGTTRGGPILVGEKGREIITNLPGIPAFQNGGTTPAGVPADKDNWANTLIAMLHTLERNSAKIPHANLDGATPLNSVPPASPTRENVTGNEMLAAMFQQNAYQNGGTMMRGRSVLVGENGPEIMNGVPGGARVLSNPTTERLLSQTNTTHNNFNLTTNSLTRPGGLALEFATMEMSSR